MERKIISRKDAKAQGLKRYYTGKPCKRGHVEERYVAQGKCAECGLEDHRKHQKDHPARYLERARLWKKENPEIVNARNARRRARKLNATPPWARTGSEKLSADQFYIDAALLNGVWDWNLVVDHIIPLTPMDKFAPQGLHVSWNLQLLDAARNGEKSNNWLWIPPEPFFESVTLLDCNPDHIEEDEPC